MKTPLQQAIEVAEQKIVYWENNGLLQETFEEVKMMLTELLPAEEQHIKDAYLGGISFFTDLKLYYRKTANDYFTKKYLKP